MSIKLAGKAILKINGQVIEPLDEVKVDFGALEVAVVAGYIKELDDLDYTKFRGKCREMSEALVKSDPSLTLVRGYYHCPIWGKQQHWWTKTPTGVIIDPSVRQFPTKGIGAEYEEFDGMVECEECGKTMKEIDANFIGRYPICSTRCGRKLVGV